MMQFKLRAHQAAKNGHITLKVAAMGLTLEQIVPQTEHLSWRLIMSREIVFHTSILTELPVVRVLYRSGTVVTLNPHTHAHILHFENLSI